MTYCHDCQRETDSQLCPDCRRYWETTGKDTQPVTWAQMTEGGLV